MFAGFAVLKWCHGKEGRRGLPGRTGSDREEREKLLLLLTTQDNHFASPEIEEAWLEEAERRYRAVQEGEENLIPADIVMRELRDIVSR